MKTPRFEGKVALVTGGNSGIGLAVARALAAEGARVFVVGRDPETLSAAIAGCAPRADGVAADASSLAGIERIFEGLRAFGGGRLDIVFANAGIGIFGPLAAITEQQYDTLMDTNVKGIYFTAQRAAAMMGAGGAMVLNASVAAAKGNPGSSLYAASKAAVRALGRNFAAELVERGICVNVVSPGPIETPIFERVGLSELQRTELKTAWAAKNPMKRFGTTEEVAETVLFLASDAASYITGVDLLVDGGLGSF